MGRFAEMRNQEVQEQIADIQRRAADLSALSDRDGLPPDARTVLTREVFRLQVLENALRTRHRAIGSTFKKADKALLGEVTFDTERMYRSRFPRLEDLLEQAKHAAVTGRIQMEDAGVSLAIAAANATMTPRESER